MENLAHTLLGLSLAKAGLERATPLATTTLIISSNLPDIDVLTGLNGTASYLEHHRGFTHGFVGLALLAGLLTLALMFVDRRFRLRRDLFRRPLRPARIFLLAYLGGLGHSFLDFTNVYGIRPLTPFSSRWFYGDLAFVIDPWIWLILGSALVWLTASDALRIVFWLAIGLILSLIVGLAGPQQGNQALAIPAAVRLAWFFGVALVIAGRLFRWGRRGEPVARYSLLALALYFCGMWMAHQSALKEARASLNVAGVTSIAAWPAPANPLLWQAGAAGDGEVYARNIDLLNRQEQWRPLPALDPQLADALRQSEQARAFLDFARFGSAEVEEKADGAKTVTVRDLRFNLRMRADLDRDLNVGLVDVRWF